MGEPAMVQPRVVAGGCHHGRTDAGVCGNHAARHALKARAKHSALEPLRYNGANRMQVLQAGPHKLIYLELQPEMVTNIAKQAGFEAKTKDGPRTMQIDLSRTGQAPLLLF